MLDEFWGIPQSYMAFQIESSTIGFLEPTQVWEDILRPKKVTSIQSSIFVTHMHAGCFIRLGHAIQEWRRAAACQKLPQRRHTQNGCQICATLSIFSLVVVLLDGVRMSDRRTFILH